MYPYSRYCPLLYPHYVDSQPLFTRTCIHNETHESDRDITNASLSNLNFTYNSVINGYLSTQKIGFNVFYVFMFLGYLITSRRITC